ncbi:NYN domain-containing protein [Nostoc sp.]|uniref:NYN domain-containing protein n=1 Tax=Nostoc sp. TaxID=1180 RepID=UPI002FF51DDE
MPSANQSSNRQTNQQQLKVGIYCDFQNVYLSQNIASSLLAFAKARGNLIIRRVYYNSLFENQASAKENLQRIGFQCEDVTCSLKNSADNQLKSDLIDDVYTALPAIMQYTFLLAPLLSSLSVFRMYLIAAGSAVTISPQIFLSLCQEMATLQIQLNFCKTRIKMS